MKNICILGSDGQLGTYLSQEIKGHNVTSFTKGEFDILNADNYSRLKDFDVVINAAAYTNVIGAETVPLNFEVNHRAVKDIANFLTGTDIHLVHISSNMVFTPLENALHKEDEITSSKPMLKYGAAKLMADIDVHKSGVKFTIVRPVWLHARGQQNFISKMMGFNKKDLSIATDDIANFTTGNMILRFVEKAIDDNIYGDFNVCTTESISRFALFKMFADITSLEYNLSEAKMSDFGLEKEKYAGLLMDNSKANEIIEISSIRDELELWWKEQEKR